MAFIPTTPGGTGTTLTSAIITQATHGFVVGDALFWNGTAYAKANAASATTSEVIGIVSSVPSANTFTLATAGLITGLSGLVSGEVYWLSDVTAGLATTTQPSAVSSVSKPLFVATSATTAQIQIFDTAPASGQTAVVQYGENLGITNGGTFTTTLTDIAGSSFTLNPGTYNVDFIVTGSNATQNVGTVALYTSADVLVPGSQAQNSWVASDKVQLIGNATIVVGSTTTYKLKGQTNAGTFTISNVPATFSATGGVSKITWTQIGASPVPMDLVGESGSQSLPADITSITANTDFDILSFSIPTAGVWEVNYNAGLSSVAQGTFVQSWLSDSANTAIANSATFVWSGNATSQSNGSTASGRVFITTTGVTTYKLRGRSSTVNARILGLNGLGGATTGNSFTNVTYRKVSGFMPSSGQTVDYVNAITASDIAVTTGTAIPFVTSSGNISNSSGVFTLSAGKTYRLEGAPRYSGTEANDGMLFQWRDITNNVLIGNIGVSYTMNLATQTAPQNNAVAVITPSSNITVRLENTTGSTRTVRGSYSYANIQQLGSSAVIAGAYTGEFISYVPTITGTTTNPTLATTNTLKASYRILGKSLQVNFLYFAAAGTGAANGSGTYGISIPAGFTINTSLINLPTTIAASGAGLDGSIVGVAQVRNTSTTLSGGAVMPISSTQLTIVSDTLQMVGSSLIGLTSANTYYKFTAEFPIL
jgi:hypothetical protein